MSTKDKGSKSNDVASKNKLHSRSKYNKENKDICSSEMSVSNNIIFTTKKDNNDIIKTDYYITEDDKIIRRHYFTVDTDSNSVGTSISHANIKNTISDIVAIIVNSISDKEMTLTPNVLSSEITPYIKAIADLQKVVNFITDQPNDPILVKSITQNSPINIGLEGAAKATEILRDLIVPWRRQHAKNIANIELKQKEIQLESCRLDINARKAAIDNTDQINSLDTEKLKAEIRQMQIENEKRMLEVHEAKINLCLKIIETLAPEMSEPQKISYILQMLEPIGILSKADFNVDIP